MTDDEAAAALLARQQLRELNEVACLHVGPEEITGVYLTHAEARRLNEEIQALMVRLIRSAIYVRDASRADRLNNARTVFVIYGDPDCHTSDTARVTASVGCPWCGQLPLQPDIGTGQADPASASQRD